MAYCILIKPAANFDNSKRIWKLEHRVLLLLTRREAGVWTQVMETLNKIDDERQGRNPEPSAACIDSQSVKTVTQGNEVGF